MQQLELRLLGGFEVSVDGRDVPAGAWTHRRATDLVKVLALARDHRMPRDRVLEALWPRLAPDAAAANLHKAASYARRAMGDRSAIVLHGGVVELAPSAAVSTDVERFEAGDDGAYRGELLPDDPYEGWAADARTRLHGRRLDVLRAQARWDDVLQEEPADEEAHRELMRRHADTGDRAAAARQYRLLVDALARLGAEPSAATLAVRRELLRGPPVQAPRALREPLESRERELAAAGAALRRAAAGDGAALLVTGPLGVGKTRLVEALLAEAEELGWHTLRGVAHREEGRAPYAPLVEALDPLVARRAELASALPDAAQAVLARLLPSARRALAAADAPADRHQIFFAVGGLLAEAAADRGVVLAVDAFHDADEATAALVHHLARSAGGSRMLVVVALRDDAPGGAAVAVRASLLERGAAEIALGPLDRPAVAAIAQRAAGRPLPAATLRTIERTAAGNPLFAAELARSVDASGDVTVPPRLRAIVGRALDRLDGLHDGRLAALAVADDGFTPGELAALAGADAGDLIVAAVAAGVVEPVGGRYRFRTALVREELAARIPAERLRAAHAAAAAQLTAADAQPEAVAHHLLRAGRPEEAVPLLARAAEWAAGVGAYRDGAEWADLALQHAGAAERPALLALRARLLHGAGDTRAAAAYATAIAAAPAHRVPALRGEQARAHLAAGDVPGAKAALEAAGAERPEHAGDLLLLRGMVAWHTGEWDVARRLAAAAEVTAASPAELVSLKGMVAHLDGAWEQGWRHELTEAWGTPELTGRVYDGYLCVTEYVLASGESSDRVAGFAKRLRAQASQSGARRGEAFAATVLGETELLVGNLDAARAHLGDAVRISREVGAVTGESVARLRLGEALLHSGDAAGARAQLDQARALAHVSAVAQHLLYHVYAMLLRAAADTDAAVALVDRAEALFDPRWVCRFCPTPYHVAAAVVCARAGVLERAREFVARAERGAAAWPGGALPAAVAEAQAELRLAEGNRRAAVEALRRAAEGYAATGQRLYEQRALARLAGLEGPALSARPGGSPPPPRPPGAAGA